MSSDYTESTNFPTLNQFQTDQAGRDTFVTRLNPDLSGASSLIYSTYLGGSGLEEGQGALRWTRTGTLSSPAFTDSTDFPLLDALQTDQLGNRRLCLQAGHHRERKCVARFLDLSRGDSTDRGLGIALDFAADIYVVGQTDSGYFPAPESICRSGRRHRGFLTKYQTGPANDSCAGVQPVVLDEVVEGKTGGGINDYQLSGAACFTGGGHTASTAAGRDVVYTFRRAFDRQLFVPGQQLQWRRQSRSLPRQLLSSQPRPALPLS